MSEIKVGDWVEVVEPTERHNRMGIKVGNRYEVLNLSVSGVFIKQEGLSYTVYIHYGRIKKVEPPIESPKLKDVPKAIDSAVSKFEMLARSYTENLSETLVAKNADYGNSFEKSYEKHGLVSAVIRLEDKLNRLESLLKNEAQVNESIDDTLLDIAGYAILTLIARGGNHDDNL